MRISVFKNDSGYSPNAAKIIDTITCNGELVEHCVTADDDKGFVEFYLTDEKGRFVIEDECVVTECAYGLVEIKFRQGYSLLDLHRIQ